MRIPRLPAATLALAICLPGAALAGDATVRLPDAAAVPTARPVDGAEQTADTPSNLAATLPAKVKAALDDIDTDGGRWLALRAYLRSERSLDARWSWTEAEIAAYEASDDEEAALAAVAAVTKAFEAANPGFSLHVNTEVRSLEEQVGKWNANASVATASRELAAAFATWSRDNPKPDAAALRAFLSGWQPGTSVTIAAPGLSPHGRARAFDFQVAKNGAVIAAADTKTVATVWEKDGWAHKLKTAVEASGAPFDGPLESPPEPWHYDYEPN